MHRLIAPPTSICSSYVRKQPPLTRYQEWKSASEISGAPLVFIAGIKQVSATKDCTGQRRRKDFLIGGAGHSFNKINSYSTGHIEWTWQRLKTWGACASGIPLVPTPKLGRHSPAISQLVTGYHSSLTVLTANTTQIKEVCTPGNLFPMVRVAYTLVVQWNL